MSWQKGDQRLLHERLAHRLGAEAGVRDLAAHGFEYRRADAARGGIVDYRPAQQVEEAERRIVWRGDRGAEQQRVARAISCRELYQPIADQLALLGRRPDTRRRLGVADPVRLHSRDDQDAGRRERERLGLSNTQMPRSLQYEMHSEDLEDGERHAPAGLDAADREGVRRDIQGGKKEVEV